VRDRILDWLFGKDLSDMAVRVVGCHIALFVGPLIAVATVIGFLLGRCK
jgi:hypothetical protein